MTVLYGRTDAHSYNCEPTGCHHTRVKRDPAGVTPWALDCAKCAPYRLREGWSPDPEKYPRTPRELEDEKKSTQSELAVMREMARAMVEAAKVQTRKG